MQDEIDPQLLALFAEAHESLPGEAFVETFCARQARARRLRTASLVSLVIVVVAAGAWAAPAVLNQTVDAMRAAADYAEPFGPLVVSPLGWAVSTVIGLAVLLRTGALRRRR